MAYRDTGTGRGLRVLGEGLWNIGSIVARDSQRAEQEAREREREETNLLLALSGRGGGLGPAPMATGPGGQQAKDPRFVELPGERGYFKRPEVMAGEAEAAETRKKKTEEYETTRKRQEIASGLEHFTPGQRISYAAGEEDPDILFPREPKAENTQDPNVEAAMRILTDKLAVWAEDDEGNPVRKGFAVDGVPISTPAMYEMAKKMAKGGGITAPDIVARPIRARPPEGYQPRSATTSANSAQHAPAEVGAMRSIGSIAAQRPAATLSSDRPGMSFRGLLQAGGGVPGVQVPRPMVPAAATPAAQPPALAPRQAPGTVAPRPAKAAVADTVGYGRARGRALQLQTEVMAKFGVQGVAADSIPRVTADSIRQEIIRRMNSEGFRITR